MPRFPADLRFGASTSAYQIEGAVDLPWRVDLGSALPAFPGQSPAARPATSRATTTTRWRDDVDLMASLGIETYRFSLA